MLHMVQMVYIQSGRLVGTFALFPTLKCPSFKTMTISTNLKVLRTDKKNKQGLKQGPLPNTPVPSVASFRNVVCESWRQFLKRITLPTFESLLTIEAVGQITTTAYFWNCKMWKALQRKSVQAALSASRITGDLGVGSTHHIITTHHIINLLLF